MFECHPVTAGKTERAALCHVCLKSQSFKSLYQQASTSFSFNASMGDFAAGKGVCIKGIQLHVNNSTDSMNTSKKNKLLLTWSLWFK